MLDYVSEPRFSNPKILKSEFVIAWGTGIGFSEKSGSIVRIQTGKVADEMMGGARILLKSAMANHDISGRLKEDLRFNSCCQRE